jgi:hypothetical protein
LKPFSTVEHVTSNVAALTFWQYASLVPNGLTTLILLAVMALQTAALEQAKAPISGSYVLLVVPKKLLKTMFVMVNSDGNSSQRVMLLCP